MSTVNEVEAAALKLSVNDRWRLASRILGSLPPPPDARVPEAILAEAQLRDAELENGTIKTLSESEFWGGVRRA
ncbi:MAG: addiction module protein [Undibacterium sp.]|nr:addiction module protein [Opitutaceae bacterium]